jgi:hypothetical protein
VTPPAANELEPEVSDNLLPRVMYGDKAISLHKASQLVKKLVRTMLNKFWEVLKISHIESMWATDVVAPWLDDISDLVIKLLDATEYHLGEANTVEDRAFSITMSMLPAPTSPAHQIHSPNLEGNDCASWRSRVFQQQNAYPSPPASQPVCKGRYLCVPLLDIMHHCG